jgi:hypothetical protein
MLDPNKIFGKWGPKVVAAHFKQDVIFKKGNAEESYLGMDYDTKKFRFNAERGSSEKRNDHSEFVTPIPDKRGADMSAVKISSFDI